MVLRKQTRQPVVVITTCAILIISSISFLRLNSFLDINVFGSSKNEVNEDVFTATNAHDGILSTLNGRKQHINNTSSHQKEKLEPGSSINTVDNQTLYKHNNTHYKLDQQTQNSLDISYIKIPDEETQNDKAEPHKAEGVQLIQSTREAVYAKLPNITKFASTQPSPACKPNLDLALPGWRWDNQTKFERLYFYHARKAGGTSLANYFKLVADHHGLAFRATEWSAAEEPGDTSNGTTFYVTHLREPVDRSISHFKYQGRWPCSQVSKWRNTPNPDWVPTRYNSKKIETWNKTGGHDDKTCPDSGEFRLHECAVNCYVQWIGGLSCPQYDIPMNAQYEVANARLRRYNFIVILEKLKESAYINAVEQFFGVKGVARKKGAFCEKASHAANALNPFNITNETLQKLTNLNEFDLRLYNDMSDCGEEYNFGQIQFDTRVKPKANT